MRATERFRNRRRRRRLRRTVGGAVARRRGGKCWRRGKCCAQQQWLVADQRAAVQGFPSHGRGMIRDSARGGQFEATDQSKSVISSGLRQCAYIRSICAGVTRPSDSSGSRSGWKNSTALVSRLGLAAPPISSQMKKSLYIE